MIKKLKRSARFRMSPPDPEGNCTVNVIAEEEKIMEVDFGMSYDAAMRLLCDMLYDHQLGLAAKRLYKH